MFAGCGRAVRNFGAILSEGLDGSLYSRDWSANAVKAAGLHFVVIFSET
jgi:hypothetical protein